MSRSPLILKNKFLLFLFRKDTATSAAYGSSQARGQIGAAAQAYTTATEMPDPRHICNLCHRLWQLWILNPLSKARDLTCILMDTMLGP